ncbi:hypothetical protein BW893_30285, partial [Bacillus wiedmannii]
SMQKWRRGAGRGHEPGKMSGGNQNVRGSPAADWDCLNQTLACHSVPIRHKKCTNPHAGFRSDDGHRYQT